MIEQMILSVAMSVGINPLLLLSICQVESNLINTNNVNDPSYGIAQVLLPTARNIFPNVDILALQQPKVNVTIAAKHFKSLIIRFKTEKNAVSAYNVGHIDHIDISKKVYVNQKYVDKVYKKYYNNKRRMCIYAKKN